MGIKERQGREREAIRRAILDENVTIPDGECIGYDLEHDRNHYHVTDSGIVIVPNHPSE